MYALDELKDELKGHAIHVSHGQQRNDAVTGTDFLTHDLHGELQVAPEGAVGYHHALGLGGGTAGVVEHSQLLGGILVVLDVLGAEVHGELLAEEAVEVLAREPYFIRACDENLIFVVGVGEHALQTRHLVGFELRPHLIANEEQLSSRVIDHVVNLLGVEFVQYRHGHGSVGQCGHEGYAPAGCVAAADGHLISLLYARSFEDDMQFLDNACYVFVLVGVGAIVRHRRQVPMVVDAFLNTSIKTWTFHLKYRN